jgi:DNA invertase Pin-like site-specific DNA recombinase
MSIGIYLRVSSKTQDTRSQEPDLQTWAKAQPDEVTWFKDKFTGTVVDRPGLDRLLADVRRGKIKSQKGRGVAIGSLGPNREGAADALG